jgi:hypothetical protein
MANGRGTPGGEPNEVAGDVELTPEPWPDPDLAVLRQHRRAPPRLLLDMLGGWGDWIVETARSAACPPDYVMLPLFSSTSALIGHARWAGGGPGWIEPPHVWTGAIGDSGDGKSPGMDCLMRDVLPEIERKMQVDFPDRLREWQAEAELHAAKNAKWKSEVQDAHAKGLPPPLPPAETLPPEPQSPRLRQHDVTLEKVAELLAAAAPKGVVIVRDELSGWIDGMNVYNEAGRAFWVEAYGGRPYRVERKKFPEPLIIPRLAVAVAGGTQPDKIAKLVTDADDGLLARMLWAWPEPIPFRLGERAPGAEWAIDRLDRLRELDLRTDERGPRPIIVPLTAEAKTLMEQFGREMQRQREFAGGLLRSAYGKARGQALRLALIIEHLWWCVGFGDPPSEISARAFEAAARLMSEYFMPMAERVYGDAALTEEDRNAATLARWIWRKHPQEVYVRDLLRIVRLPGLTTAALITKAAGVLVDAGWLRDPDPTKAGFVPGRTRRSYPVNPRLNSLAETDS